MKNNDSWTVHRVHKDGSMTVRHQGHRGVITLPASYVQQHTMLGYAATIHRSQGITCDTTHSLINSTLTRSLAYVAASRGRFMNKLYATVDMDQGETLDGVLSSIASNHDGNLTAHEHMEAARAQARSLPDMSAAYRDIDDQANELRMANTARRVLGEGRAEPFIASTAWGAISTHLRQAAREGFNVHQLLTEAFSQRELDTADDETAVMAWRLEQRLNTWRAQAERHAPRPLANISDEHLAQLQARAAGALSRARSDVRPGPKDKADQRAWLTETKDTPWYDRLHGHLSDEELQTRISAARTKLTTDSTVNNPELSRKTLWLKSSLEREQALRQLQHPEQRADEAFERGPTVNYRRQPGISRERAAEQLYSRITAEVTLRQRLDSTKVTAPDPDELPHWLAPADVLTQQDTPALWRQELEERRRIMVTEAHRLGAELAADPPSWARDLGPVPSDPGKAQQWRDLAVEISTYRQMYRVADTEDSAVPAEHLQHAAGAELQRKVTAMHKYTAQTSKPPMTNEDRQLIAEAATVNALVQEKQTPAEKVADHLQAARAEEGALSETQKRSQRLKDLADKVRQSRNQAAEEPERSRSVQEALKEIQARKQAQQNQREQHRHDDDQTNNYDRGPGYKR